MEQQLVSSYRLLAAPFSADDLDAEQRQKLLGFLSLLESWTERVDLVAPAPAPELLERHIVDSLAAYLQLVFHVEHPDGSILDVGSGGGLPGVVLAIMKPGTKVICCEPRGKRCDFLREVRRRLEIDIEISQSRIEELKLPVQPSLMVTRALGLDELFVANAARLLVPGGKACILVGPSHHSGPTIATAGEFDGYLDYEIPSSKSKRRLAIWSFLPIDSAA